MDQLVGKLQVHNLVLIEYALSNVKKFSHLQIAKIFTMQMDIFCHFNFVKIEKMAPPCPCIAAPQAD